MSTDTVIDCILKCIILQCLYKLIVISKHGQLADGPDTY